MPRKKEATFEENLEKLGEIVSLLESGEASLNDIMKNYAAGVELSQKCMEELSRVEKEMDILISLGVEGTITNRPDMCLRKLNRV